MQCIYCQNHQISRNDNRAISYKLDLDRIIEEIAEILDDGAGALGFVSPSHFIPQVKVIISALKHTGRKPITVFNSNGYDKAESIRQLEGLVDVYLPDLKYMDDYLGKIYSDTPDYSIYAPKAIREMYRQKGSTLLINDEGYAESGLIIRHLVLPGHVENSLEVLRFIADEISTNIHISLMSQYHPTINVLNHPKLGQHLMAEEYAIVIAEMEKLGFRKGWIQELKSADFYKPDFLNSQPFDSK
jgi:putative pyruvate formate lyase activating enzyme